MGIFEIQLECIPRKRGDSVAESPVLIIVLPFIKKLEVFRFKSP
jgi:hypothetical protein